MRTPMRVSRLSSLLWALAACGGSDHTVSGPDVCSQTVTVTDKLETEYTACAPDAGFPVDTAAASRIATCEQQIIQCTKDDLATLQKSVTCYQDLPPIDCAWFVPEGSGVNGGFSWGQQFLGCYPQSLSAACTVAEPPLDAGFNF